MKEKMGSEEALRADLLSDGDESPVEDDPNNPLRFVIRTKFCLKFTNAVRYILSHEQNTVENKDFDYFDLSICLITFVSMLSETAFSNILSGTFRAIRDNICKHSVKV